MCDMPRVGYRAVLPDGLVLYMRSDCYRYRDHVIADQYN